MRQDELAPPTEVDGYVQFWPAGEQVKGVFHCSACGYGVTIMQTLPRCPMCSGTSWERSSWSPFGKGVLEPK